MRHPCNAVEDTMIVTYRYDKAKKAPGPFYTFHFDNGIRAVKAEFQCDNIRELESMGRKLSIETQREIRMRVHNGKSERIHAIFQYAKVRP